MSYYVGEGICLRMQRQQISTSWIDSVDLSFVIDVGIIKAGVFVSIT